METFDGEMFKDQISLTGIRGGALGRQMVNDIVSRGVVDKLVEMARGWVEKGI
jgi:hypothetical protein